MSRRRHESSDEDDEGMYNVCRVYMETYSAHKLVHSFCLAHGSTTFRRNSVASVVPARCQSKNPAKEADILELDFWRRSKQPSKYPLSVSRYFIGTATCSGTCL